MRIGYILKVFPKLSETFILNEIIELKNKGHDVVIFSVYPSKEKIVHPEVKKFKLLDNTFYLPNQEFLGFFPLKYLTENLKEKILASRSANYFSEIIKYKGLKLDILHAHFNGISTQIAMLMSKRLSIPFTFTTHAFDIFINLDIKTLKKRINNSLQTITISNFNKKYLENLTGIKKIKVIHACPNLEEINKIRKKKSKKTNKEKFNLISIARLVEKKGLKYAILALKELISKYNLNYIIVGEGPLKNELTTLIKKLKLEKNINLIGTLTNRKVLKKIKESNIFLLPCIRSRNNDMDGVPVALMEAMALGVPVVSTKISGIAELIGDKQQGFLVEPKNVKQLANTIKSLLENKKLRTKLCKNARKKIKEEFNIHNEVGKLIDIWRDKK